MALLGLCPGMLFGVSICPFLCVRACVCAFTILEIEPGVYILFSLFSPSQNCQAGLFPSTCGNLAAMRSCGWGWIVLEHVILTQALSTKVQ